MTRLVHARILGKIPVHYKVRMQYYGTSPDPKV